MTKSSKVSKQFHFMFVLWTISTLSLFLVVEKTALALEPGDSFVIADGFSDNLGRISSTSGEILEWIGSVTPGGGENLAIDPKSLILFNVAGEGGQTALITIDPDTATTTVINDDIGLWDADGLAFSPDGTLYALNKDQKFDDEPGTLYIVDKDTGVVTLVVKLKNPSPIPPDFTGADPHVDGISFHPKTGTLYGVIGGYAKPSYLVTIDLTTGDITLIGGVDGISGYTGFDDIEDIGFSAEGILYGALGDQGAIGDNASGSFEGLLTINTETAEGTAVGPYDMGNPSPNYDVEAFAYAVPTAVDSPVPVLSRWGVIGLAGLLVLVAFFAMRRGNMLLQEKKAFEK